MNDFFSFKKTTDVCNRIKAYNMHEWKKGEGSTWLEMTHGTWT